MARRNSKNNGVELEHLISQSDDNSLSKEDEKFERFVRNRLPLRKRRTPPPPKTTFAAMLMLVGGTFVSLVGMYVFFYRKDERDRAYALFFIGALILIPGSYASLNLFGAYLDWPGYSYDAIPSYDDE
mmetsp:Transcript_15898/g.23613  ORF Transcript_15898/g.23613 Transcript_15898/m.23613 type:complete len:128 (+) Transcript_15898:85-468(+)